jgi:hypothetical protein
MESLPQYETMRLKEKSDCFQEPRAQSCVHATASVMLGLIFSSSVVPPQICQGWIAFEKWLISPTS